MVWRLDEATPAIWLFQARTMSSTWENMEFKMWPVTLLTIGQLGTGKLAGISASGWDPVRVQLGVPMIIQLFGPGINPIIIQD